MLGAMKYTIKDFQAEFKTDVDCLNYIFKMRYPDGGTCKCGKVDCFYPVTGRRSYACSFCGHQISPTEGTIFHKSPTSLRSWFFAMFLMSASKNGVAAKELERQIGVTYKCAWRMAHQIRKLMDQGGNMLSGVVEADETYVGGVQKGMKGRRAIGNKAPVIGLMERGGAMKAKVVHNADSGTLTLNALENVKQGSTMCTDEWNGYNYLKKYGFTHCRVNHSADEWVNGIAHTNSIEGFWSQLKRSINGTFHHVSKKHLQKYVNEFVYRYNRRQSALPMFHHLQGAVALRVAGQTA
jgi:transposase-like protein